MRLDGWGSRRTVCLSTQVGCGMGCVFCASGLKGVERNLSIDEILEQVLQLRNLLPPEETVTHVVVMGMGESLANFDNLIVALDRLCSAEEGLGISQRRVTISTVGLPEKIMKLAALESAISSGRFAPCTDRGVAKHPGAGQRSNRAGRGRRSR